MRVISLRTTEERCVPRVASLLFDCDVEEKALDAAAHEGGTEGEHLHRLRLYSEPWGTAEVRLGELVQQALRASLPQGAQLQGGREAAVAEFLSCRGYGVTLRTALGGRGTAECLKALKHRFIACHARQQGWPHQHFIVDTSFREQFEICRPTPRYAEALACVPEVFVGAEERLLALVEVLCREMTAAFEEAGTPLPPWRQAGAMLSKWQPRRSQDVPVAPRAPSPSPSRVGEGSAPRGSPFAAQARATFANLSNAALSAFLPAAQAPLPSGPPAKATPRNRPKSSLLAASLHGSSGPLPPNISLPSRAPGAAPPGALPPQRAPQGGPPSGGRRLENPRGSGHGLLRDVSCALSWADSSEAAAYSGSLCGGRGSSLTRGPSGGPLGGPTGGHWASSLLGTDTGRASYLVSGF